AALRGGPAAAADQRPARRDQSADHGGAGRVEVRALVYSVARTSTRSGTDRSRRDPGAGGVGLDVADDEGEQRQDAQGEQDEAGTDPTSRICTVSRLQWIGDSLQSGSAQTTQLPS